MTDINPKETTTEEEDYGHLNVRFISPGSVFFDFDLSGIAPMQMIVLGEYFLIMGKGQLLQEQAKAHQGSSKTQIEIARPNIDPGAVSRVLKG
ncbi:unnamed protein product [marine sediment metagenome]|uniref:Uncharacterized protein n=1 Tax=marine sediment metagenome TaxID=412755 RepID=X0UJP3_9ZZZZ